jgi:hypothetical protein
MLKRALKKALRTAGKELITTDEFNELKSYRNLDRQLILYSQLSQDKRELIAPFLPYSKAQLAQDLFALAFTESTTPGFLLSLAQQMGLASATLGS